MGRNVFELYFWNVARPGIDKSLIRTDLWMESLNISGSPINDKISMIFILSVSLAIKRLSATDISQENYFLRAQCNSAALANSLEYLPRTNII